MVSKWGRGISTQARPSHQAGAAEQCDGNDTDTRKHKTERPPSTPTHRARRNTHTGHAPGSTSSGCSEGSLPCTGGARAAANCASIWRRRASRGSSFSSPPANQNQGSTRQQEMHSRFGADRCGSVWRVRARAPARAPAACCKRLSACPMAGGMDRTRCCNTLQSLRHACWAIGHAMSAPPT